MKKGVLRSIALAIAVCTIFASVPAVGMSATAYGQEDSKSASLAVSNVSDYDEVMKTELNGRLAGNVPEEFYGPETLSRSNSMVHADKYKDYVIEQGIDVSVFNDYVDSSDDNIDWQAVKDQGIDFVFVRAGGRGYGSSGVLYPDNQLINSLEGAEAVGIDAGVYFFSQAITIEEAVEEAKYTMELLGGRALKLPIVFDYEYSGQSDNGRLYTAKMNGTLNNRSMTDICLAFCETVEAAGYDAAVYANASMLTDDLYADEIAEKYDIWLAHYTTQTDYEGEYDYWQYTEQGQVNGIIGNNGNVDMNFRYVDPELQVSHSEPGELTLEWNAIHAADGYNLYRKSGNGEYELIKEMTDEEECTYVDADCTAGETYTYKVTYWNLEEDGTVTETSDVYNEVSGKAVLMTPTITLSNRASDGKPVVSWTAVDGAAEYEVWRKVGSNGTYKKFYTTKGTSMTNTSATPGTVYYYKVKAIIEPNHVGNSAYSEVKSRACDLPQPVITVSNRSSNGKPVVTWSKVSGASSYKVYRSTSKNGTYSRILTTTGTSCVNSKNTTPGKVYYYKVMAICGSNSGGNSAYSAVKSRACDLPQPTTKLTTVASSGKPKLTWNKVEGASKYEVWRKVGSNGTYKKFYTTKGTSMTNTSATPGTVYYYKVKAICGTNSGGNSAFSAAKYITCDCARPTVTITRSSKGKPYLDWKAVSGASKYEVYRATSKNGKYTKIYTTSNSYYTNTGAAKGKTYYYKVRAICKKSTAGNSAYSSVVSCTSK